MWLSRGVHPLDSNLPLLPLPLFNEGQGCHPGKILELKMLVDVLEHFIHKRGHIYLTV